MICSCGLLVVFGLTSSIGLQVIGAWPIEGDFRNAVKIVDNLINLEAIADGANSKEFTGKKEGIELDISSVGPAYNYFKSKDPKFMEELKAFVPRIYIYGKILLETYPKHEASKPSYKDDLVYLAKIIELYLKERPNFLGREDNITDLLTATDMGLLIKSIVCPRETNEVDLWLNTRKEVKRYHFMDLMSKDEREFLSKIEDKVVYLGNLPSKLVLQRILPGLLWELNLPKGYEPEDHKHFDAKFRVWLKDLNYKIDCSVEQDS